MVKNRRNVSFKTFYVSNSKRDWLFKKTITEYLKEKKMWTGHKYMPMYFNEFFLMILIQRRRLIGWGLFMLMVI